MTAGESQPAQKSEVRILAGILQECPLRFHLGEYVPGGERVYGRRGGHHCGCRTRGDGRKGR